MSMKRVLSIVAPRSTRRRIILSVARDFLNRPQSILGRLSWQNFANYRLAANLAMKCNICGREGALHYDFPDVRLRRAHGVGVLRETLSCLSCKGSMRDRQMALGLLKVAEERSEVCASTLVELKSIGIASLRVLDTDSFSAINTVLRGAAGYQHSQYVPSATNGERLADNSINADLLHLPFPDASLDVVMTSDVMEHVSDHDAAHREIFRCLAPNGSYIFTVPYDPCLHSHRTLTQPIGPSARYFILDNHVHGDPHSTNGIVAHRIYGQQIFADFSAIGFTLEFFDIHDAESGVFGGDLFIATKRLT